MRLGRAVVTAVSSIVLVLGGGGVAWADPVKPQGSAPDVVRAKLPDGWQLRKAGPGFELIWQAPQPVPVGDAMVGFYSGDRLLGHPRATPDQRSFYLTLDGVAARGLTNPQVRAGGRRLDIPVAATDPGLGTGAAGPIAVAAVLPPNSVDPGVPGSFSTLSGEYTLPDVQLPGLAVPVEMRGFVVAPQGAIGQRPLVLFLHGRHATCYQGTAEPTLVWPCPAGHNSLPSYLGYQRAQQLLASQGYVTVSISANSINAQDGSGFPPTDGGAQARSSLVRMHLARWADWAGTGRPSAPAVVQAAPVPNMTRVMLVGHSRGGEGVNRAAIDSLTPPPPGQDGYQGTVRWQIRGLMLIGPTINGHNPAPDVPSMTILPSCDGDISDLEGQQYLDATRAVSRGLALHSAVFVVGANHNYFNLEWTPGLSQAKSFDDYPSPHDPVCRSISPTRLTPDQQLKVGSTYAAAAAATFVAGNDQVRPLLDGSGFRAPSVDPAIVFSHAVGGNRTPFVVPNASTVVSGAGARLCLAVSTSNSAADACWSESPHFARFERIRPEAGRYAIQFEWTATGTALGFRPPAPVSLSNAQSVAARLAVLGQVSGNPLSNQFDVAITDSANRRAVLGTVTVDALPWPTQTSSGEWGQEIRVPMTNAVAAGLNLSQITALELTPRTQGFGRAWLIDAWGWRPGLPSPQPVALPRIDLGELTVQEGNSGTTTYQMPARVTGSGNGQVRVFVVDPVSGMSTATVVAVPPGSTTISIPIQVTGNTQAGDGRTYLVAVKAISGAFVGDAYGQLVVQDDDA